MACSYCPIAQWRNSTNEYRDALTLESCIDVISKTEPTHVEVTGGEPTLVPWLDELLNFIESKGIIYLVKSNGHRRCRNQITAWHGDSKTPPANFDKILIIQTGNCEYKEKYCQEHGIEHKTIGFNHNRLANIDISHIQMLVLCPDGKMKGCYAKDTSCHQRELKYGMDIWYKPHCQICKTMDDFLIFLS
jgi:organic radical activating enzyme